MKSTRPKSADIIPLAQEAMQTREADNLFHKTGYARSSQNAFRPDDKTRYPEKTDLMTANALLNLDQLEASLWEAADRSAPTPNSPPANIVCQCWV